MSVTVESIAVVANSGETVSPAFSVQNGPLFSMQFPTINSCEVTLQTSHIPVGEVASADFVNAAGRDATALTLAAGAGGVAMHFGDIAIAAKSMRLSYGGVEQANTGSLQKQGFA